MKKKDLRNEYRQKRLDLSDAERDKMDDLMLIRFQSSGLPFIESLLSYWPIEENNEPNTHLFTEYLKFRNPELKVCYPVSDFATKQMQAVQTDIDTPFIKHDLNIYEPQGSTIIDPEQLDVVFVPLLAFDEDGYRVGYGKGFYDVFLARCGADCIKVGFSYFDAVPVIGDRHEFDVPLDMCITPFNLYVF